MTSPTDAPVPIPQAWAVFWRDRAAAYERERDEAFARLAAVEAENARLREDNRLLALAWKGVTPDRNTQIEAEADATEEVIYATAQRALSGDEQRAEGGR